MMLWLVVVVWLKRKSDRTDCSHETCAHVPMEFMCLLQIPPPEKHGTFIALTTACRGVIVRWIAGVLAAEDEL